METIPEFAKRKNCTVQTIYNAIKRGEVNTTVKYNKQLIKQSKKNDNWVAMESKKR